MQNFQVQPFRPPVPVRRSWAIRMERAFCFCLRFLFVHIIFCFRWRMIHATAYSKSIDGDN